MDFLMWLGRGLHAGRHEHADRKLPRRFTGGSIALHEAMAGRQLERRMVQWPAPASAASLLLLLLSGTCVHALEHHTSTRGQQAQSSLPPRLHGFASLKTKEQRAAYCHAHYADLYEGISRDVGVWQEKGISRQVSALP